MKKASKNKFLTCFRPGIDIDAALESRTAVDRSNSHRFVCIPIANKHETKNSETKSTFSDQKCTQNMVLPQPPKRTLSKNTRAGNKNRYSQNCFGSKRTSYSSYKEISSTGDDEKWRVRQASMEAKIQEIKGFDELPSSSSCSSMSLLCESKNSSTKEELLEKQKKLNCLGIYLVLLSLVVTVLWGKTNIIILTSTLLCLFSLRNACCCRMTKEVPKLYNSESKAYKNSQRVLIGQKES